MTKKEPGLIIQFEDCEPNLEKDKIEVEKFFKFLFEIAKEDYLKNLDYKNYQEKEFNNLTFSKAENIVLSSIMEYYEERYKKYYSTRTFEK